MDLALGVKVVLAFSEWVGSSFSGLGLACHSSGGNWSCLFGLGFCPSFELALTSRDGELALLSQGWFFSSAVVGPSFLPFLLAVSGPHSFLEWGFALRDENWPCCLGVEIGFLLSLSFPWYWIRPSFWEWGKAPKSSRRVLKREP